MEHRAFTHKANGRVNEIRTPAGIFPVATGQTVIPQNIDLFDAVWDTGATNTAIASTVAQKLNLKPITFAPVGTGGGQVIAPVHLVNIVLPNNVIVPNIQVTELKDLNSCDVLVGMDIISRGDFALTHVNGRACFSFRMPSSKEIDFVPESDKHNLKLRLGFKSGTSKKNLPKRKARKNKNKK
jgi:hypothetical protein